MNSPTSRSFVSLPCAVILICMACAIGAGGPLVAVESTLKEAIQIRLNGPIVTTSRQVVLVRDVADVTGGDLGFRTRVQSLDLDTFENGSKSISITADQIKYRLLLAGINLKQFRLVGRPTAEVVFASAGDQQQRIERQLTEQLAKQFGMVSTFLNVTMSESTFQSLSDTKVDLGACTATAAFGAELPIGKQQVEIKLRDIAGHSLTRTVPLTVSVVRDLVIAKRNISRGEKIDATNTARVRRSVADRNVRFASFEQAFGRTARSDIQQYSILKAQNIESPSQSTRKFDVKRNQLINAFIRNGSLLIQVRNARTMTDANIGDSIEIQNPISGRRILAIVVDANTVEIR